MKFWYLKILIDAITFFNFSDFRNMEFMKLTNFCVVCFVMFLSGLSYTLITPIFPLEVFYQGTNARKVILEVYAFFWLAAVYCLILGSNVNTRRMSDRT